MVKRLKIQLAGILLTMLMMAVALTSSTYAWFTFNTFTNVEPLAGTVSDGDMNLLISNSPNGPFDVTCDLILDNSTEYMSPVSTADLTTFYTAMKQNRAGVVQTYADVTESIDTRVLHGRVYLKCENVGGDIYLARHKLDFGSDNQVLAALRLGLKITSEAGTESFIFRLDDLGGTGGAESNKSVPDANTVVASVSGDSPNYTTDPAKNIDDYSAQQTGPDDEKPTAGRQILLKMNADEVATVEYWLYLEGCDEHCANEVQARELALKLGFAGVKRTEGA